MGGVRYFGEKCGVIYQHPLLADSRPPRLRGTGAGREASRPFGYPRYLFSGFWGIII